MKDAFGARHPAPVQGFPLDRMPPLNADGEEGNADEKKGLEYSAMPVHRDNPASHEGLGS